MMTAPESTTLGTTPSTAPANPPSRKDGTADQGLAPPYCH
jgi:hypothetical protein